MIEVKKVESKRQMRKFVTFPLKLYKGNKYYVPSFFDDELKLFNKKKNVYSEYSDSYFYLAYKDGKIAGRIGAIVNYACIKKTGQRNLRFTRFDVIDDFEVAKALFETVESLAKALEMTGVHGPWGYNDIDKEGMLIKGFYYIATFGTMYNYDYYPKFIEKLGYEKETEWLERRITLKEWPGKKSEQLAEYMLKRHNLRDVADGSMKMSKVLNLYGEKVFKLLDICYKDLDGVVPLTQNFVKYILAQLKLVFNQRYISVIINKDDEVVGLGAGVRSFAEAMNKCKGKVLPFGLFRILHSLKHSDTIEFLLVGIHPDYQKTGLLALVFSKIQENLVEDGIKYGETNCTLEDNADINSVWEGYPHIKHKRRRCYIKKII